MQYIDDWEMNKFLKSLMNPIWYLHFDMIFLNTWIYDNQVNLGCLSWKGNTIKSIYLYTLQQKDVNQVLKGVQSET